jgi:hypothetical protein
MAHRTIHRFSPALAIALFATTAPISLTAQQSGTEVDSASKNGRHSTQESQVAGTGVMLNPQPLPPRHTPETVYPTTDLTNATVNKVTQSQSQPGGQWNGSSGTGSSGGSKPTPEPVYPTTKLTNAMVNKVTQSQNQPGGQWNGSSGAGSSGGSVNPVVSLPPGAKLLTGVKTPPKPDSLKPAPPAP